MVDFDGTWAWWKLKHRKCEDSFSESHKNVKGFVLTNLFFSPHTYITYRMQKWEEKWGQLLQEACLCGYSPALSKSEPIVWQNDGTWKSLRSQLSAYKYVQVRTNAPIVDCFSFVEYEKIISWLTIKLTFDQQEKFGNFLTNLFSSSGYCP